MKCVCFEPKTFREYVALLGLTAKQGVALAPNYSPVGDDREEEMVLNHKANLGNGISLEIALIGIEDELQDVPPAAFRDPPALLFALTFPDGADTVCASLMYDPELDTYGFTQEHDDAGAAYACTKAAFNQLGARLHHTVDAATGRRAYELMLGFAVSRGRSLSAHGERTSV